MLEYLIKPDGDDWFEIPYPEYPRVLRPISLPSRQIPGWGSHRIEVEGAEVSFSDEEFGFQVAFETGTADPTRARAIIDEICRNIESQTGSRTKVVEI